MTGQNIHVPSRENQSVEEVVVTSCPGLLQRQTNLPAHNSPLSPQLHTMLAALRPNILSRAAAVQVRTSIVYFENGELDFHCSNQSDISFHVLF